MSSDEAASIAIVIVVCVSTSMTLSSTPVTVTVCATFQFTVVNVKLAGETVASPVSAEVTSITTFPTGCTSNTTVKVSAVAPSLTVAVVLLSVNPAVSLSVVVAVTV